MSQRCGLSVQLKLKQHRIMSLRGAEWLFRRIDGHVERDAEVVLL